MSQKNVETVRASVEAWAAGDIRRFEEAFDPDVGADTGLNLDTSFTFIVP